MLSESQGGQNEGLEQLARQVSELMVDVRGLAWELRPSVLDDLGIVPALRTYIEIFSQHYGMNVQFDCQLRKRPRIEVETTIYRIVQEALTNVGKYAGVSDAYVRLSEVEDAVEVVVEDKGQGFDREHAGRGVGLFSMEERARAVAGRLRIRSAVGEGTTIRLIVPIS
jgi:two-component system, NarL family, sensor histidine kinase NreB